MLEEDCQQPQLNLLGVARFTELEVLLKFQVIDEKPLQMSGLFCRSVTFGTVATINWTFEHRTPPIGSSSLLQDLFHQIQTRLCNAAPFSPFPQNL